jgi:hypothetical protein
VQIEGGVLQIDERRIKPGEPDQFNDLRVGDAADMSSKS